jgi:hypothetical protein
MQSRIVAVTAALAVLSLAACGPRTNVKHSGARTSNGVAATQGASSNVVVGPGANANADNPTGDPSFKYSAAALGKEPPEITVDDWVGTDHPILLRDQIGKAPAEAMLRELRQAHPGGDFEIVELFTDTAYDRDGWTQVRKQIADRNLGWPAGYGNKVQYAVLRYGFKDIPAAYLIDADGKVVWSGVPGEKSTLRKAVDTLVKQGP